MKSARERRGLTLQQIFAETRIPLRYLEALERDRLSALPSGLYLRSEVRAYAKAVHLDPEVAVRMLDQALAPPVQEVAAPVTPPAPAAVPPVRRPLVIGIGTLLVVAAAAVVLWKLGAIPISSGNRASIRSGQEAPPATGTPVSRPSQALDSSSPSATSGALPDGRRNDVVLWPEPTGESATSATAIGELDTQLTVITQPPGARVTINGIGWGSTPVTIRHLPPGEKRIRVSLDEHEAAERVVDLGDAQPGRITIRLRRIGEVPDATPK